MIRTRLVVIFKSAYNFSNTYKNFVIQVLKKIKTLFLN